MKDLDADCAAVLAALPEGPADLSSGTPAERRALYEAARRAVKADAPGNVAVASVATEVVGAPPGGLAFHPQGRDADGAGTVLLHFHGGGFTIGSPETHRVAVALMAQATGLPAVSGTYGLTPEHSFPKQRDDAAAIAAAVLEGRLPGAPRAERIILSGDSAGAAVAFWAESGLPEPLRPRVSGIAAFYGALGLAESPSITALGPLAGGGMSPADIREMYRLLGSEDPTIRLTETAPAEGAPVYVAAAGCDPFLDDSLRLHARLEAIGRPSTLDHAPALPHAWLHIAARAPAAAQALDRAAAWIRGRLLGPTSAP